MKLSMLILAGCLVLEDPAVAQQNYDFVKRDNPFGSQQQQQQQQVLGAFGFCWMSSPMPNTKQVMITNVFQTQQSASTLKAELEIYQREMHSGQFTGSALAL